MSEAIVLNRDLTNPNIRVLTLWSHWFGWVSPSELTSMQERLNWSNVQMILCHVLSDMKKYLSTWASFDAFGIRPLLPWSDRSNRVWALSIPVDRPYQILRLNERISTDQNWMALSRQMRKVPIFIQTLLNDDYSTVADWISDAAQSNWLDLNRITISFTSNYPPWSSFDIPLIDWAKSLVTK